MSETRISRISGALVEARPMPGVGLYELARVGERQLLGEVVRLAQGAGTLQVYEETSGLQVGEPVTLSGQALAVSLGPGLLGSILDGLARPLDQLTGDFIASGVSFPTLNPEQRWNFVPRAKPGDQVTGGDVLGEVEEKPGFRHGIMVPPTLGGKITRLSAGAYTINDAIGELEGGTPLYLGHRWPVRQPRPIGQRLPDDRPLITGQRVFDFLYPVAEGGTVGVPGGFGTGKTIIEQSLAKYAEADVVVYIGCGERGNEMAEVLNEFPHLMDPRTGRSIMDRTVMVVNTSNMPVAAREASVYLGMTIAEYYRDMGYRVAVMADSLSRWAEALREISARLQEMPGEEGYPTYLATRLSTFYERAGRVEALGQPSRPGALTLISAISPPGGDFSEPVTQASLRVVGALWALSPELAHQRHFPAVDWDTSYSLYEHSVTPWFHQQVAGNWSELRSATLDLLQRDRELREISALIGPEALQDPDRLVLEAARVVREVILAQSAYSANDAWSSMKKTHTLAQFGIRLYRESLASLQQGTPLASIHFPEARRLLMALREAPEQDFPLRVADMETWMKTIGKARGAPP
jgi:V/A-type H+-transporting ATPase subunit A